MLDKRVLGVIFGFIFILFASESLYAYQNEFTYDSLSYYTSQLFTAGENSKSFPNESYQIYSKSHFYFKKERDTSRIVACLLSMAAIQKEKGKFSLSFDHLWEAQYLARNTNNKHQKAKVLIQLARLYDDFNLNKEAQIHLEKALRISKKIFFENKKDVQELNASYMNLAVRQRKSGNYQNALNYLDSCKYILDSSIEMPFWDAERGNLMLKLGKYKQADTYLQTAKRNAELQNPTYLVNIYMYMGELKIALSEPDSSIFYFNKSMDFIYTQNFGKVLAPEILMRLSEVYFSLGKADKAYEVLSQSKAVADTLIQIKNSTNSELFQIKNTYLESINQKNELLIKRDNEIKENKQIQFRLKIILVLVLLLGVVLVVVVRMRLKLKRTLLNKKETELKSKLSEERSKSELEMKSKELTSYALQLIDKDTTIDELLKALQEESPQAFKPLNNKYKKGSKDLWDEFNLRFTKVNSAFYNRLKSKHPDLSTTEQKHCALLKLNFATKEMARMLNIEIHSVHMSRSRIRRKIGLQRSESLEKYIANL